MLVYNLLAMMDVAKIVKAFDKLDKPVKEAFVTVLTEIQKAQDTQITKKEFHEFAKQTQENFNRLWEAIQQLAEAQRKTEERLSRLTERVDALAEAQRKTEERLNRLTERVDALAEAQRKTEERLNRLTERVDALAEAQAKTEQMIQKLVRQMSRMRKQIGGLSRSVAYALENEAYRALPKFLKEKFNIEITEKMIRQEIEGQEINMFARAKSNGKEVLIVGEAVLRLDDVSKVRQVIKKSEIIRRMFNMDVLPIIVTHFARPRVHDFAKESGIIVIQSFEWV